MPEVRAFVSDGCLDQVPPAPAPPLSGLPPLLDACTRVLVLGSFPGQRSLAQQAYYAHPQNQFWPMMCAILAPSPFDIWQFCYEKRSKWLLQQGVGVWDVYGHCQRQGSLDSQIRQPQVNDLTLVREACPLLQAVVHNGAESYKHARHSQVLGVPVYRLPSTSPAHASLRFSQKLAAWQAVFERHGLPLQGTSPATTDPTFDHQHDG